MNDPTLTADGFDDAILGIVFPMNSPPLVVYDRLRCIDILMTRDGMTAIDADEYMNFNVEGAYVGKGTPLFLVRATRTEIDEIL